MSMVTKRMGRPKKKKADLRTELVKTLLTKAERKKAQAAADEAGMTLSNWTRNLIRQAVSG